MYPVTQPPPTNSAHSQYPQQQQPMPQAYPQPMSPHNNPQSIPPQNNQANGQQQPKQPAYPQSMPPQNNQVNGQQQPPPPKQQAYPQSVPLRCNLANGPQQQQKQSMPQVYPQSMPPNNSQTNGTQQQQQQPKPQVYPQSMPPRSNLVNGPQQPAMPQMYPQSMLPRSNQVNGPHQILMGSTNQAYPQTVPPNNSQVNGQQQPLPQVYPQPMPPRSNLMNGPQQPPMQQAYPQSMPPRNNQAIGQQQQQPPPMPQTYPQTMPLSSNQSYIGQQQQQQQPTPQQPYTNNVIQRGFDSMWGHNTIDLMQNRHILPTIPVEPPKISLEHQFYESVNCSPDIFRCTLTKIPESNALLQKSRLPLGILIHPFRDLNNLPVIQCSTIVRCRSCRTYINPFVYFVDSKKWKCNLCFRINELPDEFQYDPVSKSYGDVTRRPEVKSSTIEFIAPSEYMLRPPQPAIYLFLLDVSMIAQQSGYLRCVCESLTEHLESMPGDARTQIGFVAYNSAVHFYSLAEGFIKPREITVVDIDDPFLPCPDNLLINLKECKELIKDLLVQLPIRFAQSHDSDSALGAALQVAFKLMQQTGGRVTVFQTCLPNLGPGALQSRENPNERSAKEIQHLGPATDFYKRHALECSGQQIAVDLFLMNSQYSDLATISGISKFSGGCIHHFPLFNAAKPQQVDSFKRCFERYLTRKIGFESVMRIRCTRGLTIHTFHGNFFVRSTDLLSLPNVNPDAGYGMQISYEENLGDSKTVCFQAALLYTSSKGERRIRVHTLCLPVTTSLTDIIYSADAQAIIGLISKMAVDRSLQSSLADARDAFINASCDIFSAYHTAQNIKSMNSQLIAPTNLSLLPLYMLALLKHPAFRTGTSTRLDDRVFAMCELKTLPLDQLIRYIYPDLYHLDCLFSENNNENNADDSNGERPDPPLLQLSAEHLKQRSMFLLDCGTYILLLVGSQVPPTILKNVFDISNVSELPDLCFELPNTRTADCDNLHSFLEAINVEKPYTPPIQIIRDNSPYRSMFVEKLVDDRSESSLSYYEFLQHLRTQVK